MGEGDPYGKGSGVQAEEQSLSFTGEGTAGIRRRGKDPPRPLEVGLLKKVGKVSSRGESKKEKGVATRRRGRSILFSKTERP